MTFNTFINSYKEVFPRVEPVPKVVKETPTGDVVVEKSTPGTQTPETAFVSDDVIETPKTEEKGPEPEIERDNRTDQNID